MLEVNFLNILLGFLAGMLVSKFVNRFRASGLIIKTMTVAQIQALRMLSNTITHFYRLHHWHDKVAWSIDEAQTELKEAMQRKGGVAVNLPDGTTGFVELTEEDMKKASESWSDSRVQELKVVWNMVNEEEHDWRDQSILLLQASMFPYHKYLEWNTWKGAMEYLAQYELLLLKSMAEMEKE
jgi:hypothetical protein